MRTRLRSIGKVLAGRLGLHAVSESAREVTLQTRSDVVRWLHWGAYGDCLRFLVPMQKTVMQGGVSFADPLHHFRRALDQGQEALKDFYRRTQPKSLLDWHSVTSETPEDFDVPAWEVPWIQRTERRPPPGEAGLAASHGLSFYGPVSSQKLTLEYQRLMKVRHSIRTQGYRPDQFGDMDGYFMLDDQDDFRFFVRGGKHRAAVLASLEESYLPVVFKRDWPRAIRLRDSHEWPLVAAATLSEDAARAVFLSYFGRRQA